VDSRAALDSVSSDSDASAAGGFSPAVSPAASPCLAGGHLVYRTPFFWQRVSVKPDSGHGQVDNINYDASAFVVYDGRTAFASTQAQHKCQLQSAPVERGAGLLDHGPCGNPTA